VAENAFFTVNSHQSATGSGGSPIAREFSESCSWSTAVIAATTSEKPAAPKRCHSLAAIDIGSAGTVKVPFSACHAGAVACPFLEIPGRTSFVQPASSWPAPAPPLG
jgi:hypothetical protein